MRVHRTVPYLLSTESPSAYQPELVYRARANAPHAPGALAVDYDLSRLRKAGYPASLCAELSDVPERYRSIVAYTGRHDAFDQIELDLSAAARILEPAGELRVVVPPKTWQRRVRSVLELQFAAVEEAQGPESALLIGRGPTPQLFVASEMPPVVYADPRSGRTLTYRTRAGMFSPEHVDTGTALLLASMPPLAGRRVLDVGCGYGAIGLVAAAGGADVTMIDADARAVKLVRANAAENGLRADAVLDDRVRQESASFDYVLSNPPTHAGSETLQALFADMVRTSRRGGAVLIVVRHHLNYEKWLEKMGHVDRLATEGGFKVLRVER